MFGFGKKSPKEKASEDDFDLDFDEDDFFNDSELDSGVSDDYNDNRSNRSVADSPTIDIARGAIGGIFSPTGLKTVVNKALPSSYGELFENLSSTAGEAGSSISESIDSLRNVKKQTQGLFRRAGAFANYRGLNLLGKALTKLGGEEERDISVEDREKEGLESTISSTISSLFSIQNEIEEKRREEDENREDAREAIRTSRHESQMKGLGSIDATLRQQALFNNTNTFNYYRKSIELKIRQLHVSTQLYKNVSDSNNNILKALNDIKLNTSLPEYVKQKNTEALKEKMRDRFIDGIDFSFFGNRLVKGIANDIKEKIGSVKDLLDQVEGPATNYFDMMEQERELEEAFGGGESNYYKNTKAVSNTLLGWVGSIFKNNVLDGDWADDEIKEKVHKFGRKANNWNKNFGDNLVDLLGSKKFRDKVINKLGSKGIGDDEYTSNSITYGLFSIFDYLISKTKSIKNESLNGNLGANTLVNNDYSGEAGQRRLQVKTINHIIPGYLARILREVTSLRTGNEEELLEYNHESGYFVKTSEFRKEMKLNSINFRKNAKRILSSGRNALEAVNLLSYNEEDGSYKFKENFTETDLDIVGRILTIAGNNVSRSFLTDKENWKLLGDDKSKIIVDNFKRIIKSEASKRDENDNYVDKVDDLLDMLKSSSIGFNPDMNIIRQYISQGRGNYIKELGLSKIDREKLINEMLDYTDITDEHYNYDLGGHTDDMGNFIKKDISYLDEVSKLRNINRLSKREMITKNLFSHYLNSISKDRLTFSYFQKQ